MVTGRWKRGALAAKFQVGERGLLWLTLFSLLQAGVPGVLPPSIQSVKDTPATAGEWRERELSAGQTHSYPFELSQGRFLRIDFYSSNLDLVVSMAWPGGKKSLEWSIPKRVTTPISFVVDVLGTYHLKVQSSEKIENSGVYRIEIKTLRPVSAQDQKQVAACRRLSNATQLRRQWTEASLRSAIGEYERALSFWKAVRDRTQEAVALKNTGDIWEMLSERQMAFTCYKKAQAIYSQLKNQSEEIKVINAISALLIDQGEYQKALEIYTPELMPIGDPWERAQYLHNLGAAYYGMNEMPKATDSLNGALELRELLHDRAGQADTLRYLGYVNHAVKNVSAAEQYYRHSLDLWRAAENPRGIALVLTALGHLSNISGERQRALEYYDQSLQIFQTIGNLSGRYSVLEGMAYLYAGLGEKERALHYYLTALNLARQAKDLATEGSILYYIGEIYGDLGDYKNALQYSQQAVLVNRSVSSNLLESYALANLGNALEAVGKQGAAVENYTRALELSRKGGDRFLEGLLLNAIGHLNHESGQLQKALDYYRQALSLQQKSNDSVRMPGTLYNLARAERDTGNLDLAIQYAGQGLEITEALRGKVASPELRGSYLASVHQQYELLVDLLMRLRSQHPSERFDAEALQTSERARARSLLDILSEARAQIRQGADPALLERERSLQQSLNAKADQQMRLLGGKHSDKEQAALEEQINTLAAEYQEVQALIRSKSPHYAALTQPKPLSLPEIQHLLDEETILLEYALGDERSYLWAVTPTTFQSYELPKRVEVEKGVSHVRELMLARQSRVGETAAQHQQRIKKADSEYWWEAAALSQMLLGPVSDRLESKRLLVVTEGALQYLPFGALPKPRSPGSDDSFSPQSETPLIADHEIVSLPSASVLAVLRQEIKERPLPPKMVAVLADPVFEADDPRIGRKISNAQPPETAPSPAPTPGSLPAWGDSSHRSQNTLAVTDLHWALREVRISAEGIAIPRLPGTREEANAIMALVPEGLGLKVFDFNANRDLAMGSELGQYRIVHFATHGFLNGEHPELSGLVLSLVDERGRPQDGFLRLHDIYNLRLPVDLVVLSACNSGLGKEIRGEGLVGIVRGFMYAGAARVVASLWKVEDEATAMLMKRFYERMLLEGDPPSRALQMAELDILRQKRWHSPYYWAAFVMQGEWR
jgi:CHAT domain-containing protein/tetratricopeptide (TPR) repeat protein